MSKALSRSYRSLNDEARETARAAARRSGKSLHDWLDDAIREKAHAVSLNEDDDEADFIDPDEFENRTASSRRRSGAGPARRDRRSWREDDRLSETATAIERRLMERDRRAEEMTRRLAETERSAVDAVERRLAESERNTARALSGIAELIERRDEGADDNAQLSEVIARLQEIEGRISRQDDPAAVSRPIRGALARLESRIETLSKADRGDEFHQAMSGLDKRLDDIARRLDDDTRDREAAREREAARLALEASREREAARIAQERIALEAARNLTPSQAAPQKPARNRLPLADAIAEIAERRRVLDGDFSPAPLPRFESDLDQREAPAAPKVLDELQSSLSDLSRQMQDARAHADEKSQQQIVAMRQVEALRREVEQVSGALGALASRANLTPIEAALRDLTLRIDAQRDRGVAETTLAPAELIAGELRAALRDLDSGPTMRALRSDIESIGRRLDALTAPGQTDQKALSDLSQQTAEVKSLLSALAARPLPVEKLETRVIDLTQRVDGLSLVSGAVKGDLDESARAIRSIVAAETDATLSGFTRKLDDIAAKLESVVAKTGVQRFDELTNRIDRLGEQLVRRIDNGVAGQRGFDASPLENLVAQLGKKIDAALDPSAAAKGFETLERRIDQVSSKLDRFQAAPDGSGEVKPANLRDLTDRIDFVHNALAARIEEGARGRDVARANEVAVLVDQLSSKLEGALDPKADNGAFKSLEAQIGKLSRSLDQGDRNVAAMSSIERKIGELVSRIDETRAATAQNTERAVREATAEILREAASKNPGALDGLMERELFDLRKSQDESGARTHETLKALHETLERVVDRLAAFEDELSDFRKAPQRAAFVQPPHVDAAGPRPAAMAASAEAMDLLLEPASPPAARRPQAAEAVSRQDRVVQSDFIAAARRAAQQAAADAEAAESSRGRRPAARREPAVAVEPVEDEAAPARMTAAAQSRKRPLLLALGALVLLVGGYQVMRIGLEGRDMTQHAAHETTQDGEAAPAADRQHPPTVIAPPQAETERAAPDSKAARPGAPRMVGPGANSLAPQATAPRAAAPIAPIAAPQGPVAPLSPPGAASRPGAGPTLNAPIPGSPLLGPPPPTGPRVGPAASAPNLIDGAAVGSIKPPAADQTASIRTLATQGDAGAQYEIGSRYVEGRGLARDPKAGAGWLEKAADQGHALAQYRLGSMYEKGVGVERDFTRARKMYRSAAENGNARAMHNLAVLSAEGGGEGKPDYAAASEWFRKAADYGVRDSQYNLAILYARGLGVQQSLVQSYFWFAVAANQGDADAGKKRDDVGARLDSKELAAAKSLLDGFKPKQPAREANVSPPATSDDAKPAVAPLPGSKAKVS